MNYYIDIKGKTAGPFTLAQVKVLFENGSIDGNNLYATVESKDWMPVQLLTPLFQGPILDIPAVQTASSPSIVINNQSHNTGYVPPAMVPSNPYRKLWTFRILSWLIGGLGIHNFYAKRYFYGVCQLLITLISGGVLGVFVWIWSVIETGVVYHDGEGRPLIQ